MDKGRYREELRALEESCKPIDEAIARHSVTSEEIQEAIEYYRHIANITKGEESLAETSANLAITALQADKLPSAIKWTGNNLREIINLTGWNESASSKWTWKGYEQIVKEKGLKIFTPDGSARAGIGDWIVRDGDSCHILQAYQPWIPVSERFPTKDDALCHMVFTWSEKKKELEVQHWRHVRCDPGTTHWKPLPEPPKGEVK